MAAQRVSAQRQQRELNFYEFMRALADLVLKQSFRPNIKTTKTLSNSSRRKLATSSKKLKSTSMASLMHLSKFLFLFSTPPTLSVGAFCILLFLILLTATRYTAEELSDVKISYAWIIVC
jgi:hypothetical protein